MKKIVAIAGHWNPLHIGHINLIKTAKSLGDILYVIVANDKQAKNKRPKVFMKASDRALIMYNIKDVDYATISVDVGKSVCKTLAILRPDVFASGCDKKHPDAIEEEKMCKRLGIKTYYNVGGKKIESSSKLLKRYASK